MKEKQVNQAAVINKSAAHLKFLIGAPLASNPATSRSICHRSISVMRSKK
jgi:hypothetical protein